MRWILLTVLTSIVTFVAPSLARADVTLAKGSRTPGYVHLVASATPAADDLRIVEVVNGADVAVASTATRHGIDAQVPWTCTTVRSFAAIAGDERTVPLDVTTPSCATRIEVSTWPTVALGGDVRVHLLDRWRQGNLNLMVCATRPDAERSCDPVTIPPSQYLSDTLYRADQAGQWRIDVDDATQGTTRKVIVVRQHYPAGRPTVLATGDSMMLATTTALHRRLRTTARLVRDIYVGSGITRPFVVDWSKLPGRQVRAYHPDAAVLSLGMGDGRDLDTPDGPAACCGSDYVTAYAKRVKAMMRTYSRGGRGAVVWLNVPYERNPDRWPEEAAVNRAAADAAVGMDRVRVIDLARKLTPDGTFQASMMRHGKRVRLRTDDGIHLTPGGAAIASRLTVDALRKLGVKLSAAPARHRP